MKYIGALLATIAGEVAAVVTAPVLPLFAEERDGKLDNAKAEGVGARLPTWLAWLDTPDNSLDGDAAFIEKTAKWPPYLRRVRWLLRNRAYGLKTGPLAYDYAPGKTGVQCSGDPSVNRNNGVTGTYTCRTSDGHWQRKIVKKLIGDWGIMWNFGWQLDEFVPEGKKGKAMLQLSPRFVRIK